MWNLGDERKMGFVCGTRTIVLIEHLVAGFLRWLEVGG